MYAAHVGACPHRRPNLFLKIFMYTVDTYACHAFIHNRPIFASTRMHPTAASHADVCNISFLPSTTRFPAAETLDVASRAGYLPPCTSTPTITKSHNHSAVSERRAGE